MLIHFIKFFHVLIALGLMSLILCCLILIGPSNQKIIKQFNKTLLLLSPFALITGTLLVHPKHFTFHTPWILAAYLFLFVFCAIIAYILTFQKSFSGKWRWRAVYLILMGILIVIVHDAVSKSSFL